MLPGSNIDWMYRMQPDQHSCRSRMERSCAMPRGKVRNTYFDTTFLQLHMNN